MAALFNCVSLKDFDSSEWNLLINSLLDTLVLLFNCYLVVNIIYDVLLQELRLSEYLTRLIRYGLLIVYDQNSSAVTAMI